MIRDVLYSIIYSGVGIYLVLIALGFLHRGVLGEMTGARRLAAWIMALGFLGLGGHHAWQYYRFSSPEGRQILEKMKETEGNVIIGSP
jgi:hypothetical protein